MPHGIHQQALNLPIEKVWSFVSDINNWAPLVPGYIEHHIVNDRQSTWKFKGDIGVIQKTVHLQIDIIEWKKPTLITFNLTGLNENFKGDGYFEANPVDKKKTNISGYMNINAKGMMGPVINPVLKTIVPKTTKELTEAVVDELEAVTI